MIPLSAWVSLSAGVLLIGLEYIAPAVVTAAGNISPLLLLPASVRSTFFLCSGLIVSARVSGLLHGSCARRQERFVTNVRQAWFPPKLERQGLFG